jgi:hypothetical protein
MISSLVYSKFLQDRTLQPFPETFLSLQASLYRIAIKLEMCISNSRPRLTYLISILCFAEYSITTLKRFLCQGDLGGGGGVSSTKTRNEYET